MELKRGPPPLKLRRSREVSSMKNVENRMTIPVDSMFAMELLVNALGNGSGEEEEPQDGGPGSTPTGK